MLLLQLQFRGDVRHWSENNRPKQCSLQKLGAIIIGYGYGLATGLGWESVAGVNGIADRAVLYQNGVAFQLLCGWEWG